MSRRSKREEDLTYLLEELRRYDIEKPRPTCVECGWLDCHGPECPWEWIRMAAIKYRIRIGD